MLAIWVFGCTFGRKWFYALFPISLVDFHNSVREFLPMVVTFEILERRRRSACTSNPKNRPGAARPGRRKVGAVHSSRYEGKEKKADLCDYISSQIPDIADLLQEKSSTNHGGRRRKTTRYELKVSVNPNSSVCEIILPGTFLFRSDSVLRKGLGHGLKRHKSLHLPRVEKEEA